MVYKVIGLMSGSSLDGLDIAFAEFNENAGSWNYEIKAADCYVYPPEWIEKLNTSISLNALDYQLLHTEYGHYLGCQVNKFIEENHLQFQVSLVSSHGHTTFHVPSKKMTAQLGDGASIASETQLPVVTDLRALDLAFGGQGAPIVPIGEKLLLGDYDFFLNLGGIANISFNDPSDYIAYDICPANRVLNMLANDNGKEYDEGGNMARSGKINEELFRKLNSLDYYKKSFPKSLANDYGTDIVYPLVKNSGCSIQDSLRTYVEHIAVQIKNAIVNVKSKPVKTGTTLKLLATGGGAFNIFLVEQLKEHLRQLQIEIIIPEEKLVKYKEAVVMALIGVLRWRQEYNVLSSVTGARRDSIGGALWIGQEA